jgi:hypothetical protein
LSGPSVLDMSRHFIAARFADSAAQLTLNWLPQMSVDELDRALQNLGRTTPLNYLRGLLPDRLAQALCAEAGVAADTPGDQLRRESRQSLVQNVTKLPLPIAGNRGYNYAEVTAGGVPLAELNLKTMESRRCPGLFLCGEICDVDGRIGGYNFQWAWASGYTAGISAGN